MPQTGSRSSPLDASLAAARASALQQALPDSAAEALLVEHSATKHDRISELLMPESTRVDGPRLRDGLWWRDFNKDWQPLTITVSDGRRTEIAWRRLFSDTYHLLECEEFRRAQDPAESVDCLDPRC